MMNDDGDGDDDLLLSSLSFPALNIHTNLFKLPLYYNFGILFSAFSSHSVDVTGESALIFILEPTYTVYMT